MTTVLYDAPGPAARRTSRIASGVAALVLAAVLVVFVLRLQQAGALDAEEWEIFSDPEVWTFLIVDGLGATLRAAVVAALLAAVLGVLLAVLRRSSVTPVRLVAAGVIELFRGLPVVLLMFFGVIAIGLTIFQGVVFGLVVYNGAVIAEILRAGIASLPRGQTEAGAAIGLTRGQVLRIVLLPQAIRQMLPTLISQFVVLLKDTSLGYIIGYAELLRATRNLTDFYGSGSRIPLFFVAAAIYVLINLALSRVAVWVERRGSSRTAGKAAVPAAVDAGANP
jgi:glutamate transport system permease protein